MRFTVDGYEAENGEKPFEQAFSLFRSKSEKLYDKVMLWKDYIADDQYHKMPYCESLGENLFVLRVQHGKHFARLFFTKTKTRVVLLLSGYYKTTNKMPDKEHVRARKLKEGFEGGRDAR